MVKSLAVSSRVCWCSCGVEQSGMLVAHEIILSALGLFRFSILDSQSHSQSQSQSLDKKAKCSEIEMEIIKIYLF